MRRRFPERIRFLSKSGIEGEILAESQTKFALASMAS